MEHIAAVRKPSLEVKPGLGAESRRLATRQFWKLVSSDAALVRTRQRRSCLPAEA